MTRPALTTEANAQYSCTLNCTTFHKQHDCDCVTGSLLCIAGMLQERAAPFDFVLYIKSVSSQNGSHDTGAIAIREMVDERCTSDDSLHAFPRQSWFLR